MFEPEFRAPLHTFTNLHTNSARSIDFSRRIAVMAVVNRTKDSFFDSGATFALDRAVEASLAAASHGADWVDIGGVPFSPGPELPWQEEADRVVPVIQAVREASDVILSADTFSAKVADAALRAGANVVNDTTGLSDPDLLSVVAEHGAHIVITHSLAAPRTVFPKPQYDDVVASVRDYLAVRIEWALNEGVAADKILIDPGHDLNKNTLHSLEITRRYAEIAKLGFPGLAAVSNKDFIGEAIGVPKFERQSASIAAATMSVMNGARVVRMHDAKESVKAMRLLEVAMGWREPDMLKHNMGDLNDPADLTPKTDDAAEQDQQEL